VCVARLVLCLLLSLPTSPVGFLPSPHPYPLTSRPSTPTLPPFHRRVVCVYVAPWLVLCLVLSSPSISSSASISPLHPYPLTSHPSPSTFLPLHPPTANDQGNRTTPSYVAFTESERLIGDAAKNQVAMNASNTVFDAKRLIGRRFSDPVVQADMKHWPFTVVQGPGGKPLIQVNFKGETKTFAPEEISSMVLIKMREIAEAYLGE